ncbi:MAG: extracellular solute-binding protein [Candidatus Methanomethyliaceae archaeon]
MVHKVLSVSMLLAFAVIGAFGEQQVVVYGWAGDWDLWFKEWGATFEAETGIKVLYMSGSGLEMYSRVIAEKDNPRADLLLSSAAYLFQLANMGLFEVLPYSKLVNAANVDERFKYERVVIWGWDLYMIGYNTERVSPEDIPTKWQDLANPKFKGRLIVRPPASDLTAWIWIPLADKYGEDVAWAVTLGMFNNAVLWAPSTGDLVSALVGGEGDVAPASFGHIMLARYLWGAPIAPSLPDYPVVMLNGFGLIKGAPHPDAAVKFLDFFLGEYVQDYIMNKLGTSISVNQVVKLNNPQLTELMQGKSPQEILQQAYFIDWPYWTEFVGDQRTRIGLLAAEIERRVKGLSQ